MIIYLLNDCDWINPGPQQAASLREWIRSEPASAETAPLRSRLVVDRFREQCGHNADTKSSRLRYHAAAMGHIATSPPRLFTLLAALLLLLAGPVVATEDAAAPLHVRIDAMIESAAGDVPLAGVSDDAEFLRRIHLDLVGTIPTAAQARAFLDDTAADKRTKLIDALLADERFPRRMTDLFHVILMERRGDHPEWQNFLYQSFKANKPWNQLAREILHPDPRNEATRAAAFFYTRRLQKEGEQPTDYPGLTRDVGRLFLGVDLQCAQCHNHLTIDDYKQADFQGLFGFYQNIAIHGAPFPAIVEKPMAGKISFVSVFNKRPRETGPRVPTLPESAELMVPALEKGKELAIPADPKASLPGVPAFSPLAQLARQLPADDNRAFARSFVNRFWAVMMGRGIVHPFDLHHTENPPSHPQLLELLTDQFIKQGYDTRWLLRELVLSKTYQRSSLLPESATGAVAEDRFAVALERRLAPEQLLRSMLTTAGELERVTARKDTKDGDDLPTLADLTKRFEQSFAGEPKEPEIAIEPSLKAALFMRNDVRFLSLFKQREGNLLDRLSRETDETKWIEELFLATLSRPPTKEERDQVAAFMAKQQATRGQAMGQLVWAMLTSAEFGVNH